MFPQNISLKRASRATHENQWLLDYFGVWTQGGDREESKSMRSAITLLILAASICWAKNQKPTDLALQRSQFAAVHRMAYLKTGYDINVWVHGTALHLYHPQANQTVAYRMHMDWVIPECTKMKQLGFTRVDLRDGDHTVHTWIVADGCSSHVGTGERLAR